MALVYQSPTRNLPEGYSFRGATLNDIPVIAYLFNQRQLTSMGTGFLPINEMRKEWKTPHFNPAMDVRLVFDKREHLIGYIEVWTIYGLATRPWLWGCVHPDYENRGIGTALLSWAEARVRLAMELLPENLRVAPQFGTHHNMVTAADLCRVLGWKPIQAEQNIAPLAKNLISAVNLIQKKGGQANSAYDIYEKEIRSGDEYSQNNGKKEVLMKTRSDLQSNYQLPKGYSAYPGKISDYLQAFELINTYARYFNGHVDLNDPELIRLGWQSDGFHAETDILTVYGPDGKLVGLVETWLTSQPPVHPWNWICVHPEHIGQGIWEYLLQWVEIRSKAAMAISPVELRVAPQTGLEHHNKAGIQIIQKLGWEYIRSYYRMMINLDSKPELPPTAANIQIRPYDPSTETEAVYRASNDAFRDHFGFIVQPFEHGFREFKHNMINIPGYDPAYWFVVADRNEIVGICLCRPVDVEDPESGWINTLGVRRDWRKQGLGSILLKHAFTAFYNRGQKRAALGVDAANLTGALHLYVQAGMHVVRQYDHFEKELRPGLEISTQELT